MRSLLQRFETSFASRYRSIPAERWCAAYFEYKNRARPKGDASAPLLVVEAVEDLFFYGLHGEIVSALRAIRKIRVQRFVTHTLNPGATQSLRAIIAGRLHALIVSRRKWRGMYDAFCDKGGCRSDSPHAPWREVSYLWRAWRLFRGLQSKDQLASLKVRGILIGDLVIDTYLRFKPIAEVDIRDRYLFVVLRQTVKDVDSAHAYFRKVRPSIYLATYATYIQHGIPARVAVALGIETWSFANAQEFGTRLVPDHLLHTKQCNLYSAEFAKLPDPDVKIAKAGERLGSRVAGIADPATANQRSAYAAKTEGVPDVHGAAVIFLHDFYDSPHIYQWMVFHDFWEWACTTIETLQSAGLPFFLKPHPNQRTESIAELERLRKKYPGVNFLSHDISNRQLVDGGMGCAITVYGSVAAEMAYLGIPSISCGDNPHASFDTFHLATNKEEYGVLLKNFPNLRGDPERMRLQACAFYYMHYLNVRADEQELQDNMMAFYLNIVDMQAERKPFSPSEILDAFGRLENAPEFKCFVANVNVDLGRLSVVP